MRRILCFLIFFIASGSLAFAQNVQYSYDALGRLSGVIDQNGNAAQYSYDASGNIVGITRFTSTQTAILSFTPASGPPGTNVTIRGINLTAPSGSTTISFNGTASVSPSSASINQLVVQVPAGASTGPISVSAGSGTATSAVSFTVTSTLGDPQITGISPAIANAGTLVTVSGNNFSLPASTDILSLNGQLISLQSATTTSLQFAVPSQLGSGHLSLTASAGRAKSSGDLYVPPAPFTAAQVTSYQRLTPGTSFNAAPQNNGDIAMLLFEAKEGKRASILLENSTFPGICYSSIIQMIEPDGSNGPVATPCGQGTEFLDAFTMTEGGTYAAVIEPQSGVGSADVTAYVFDDVSGTLAWNTSTPVSISTPGQNAYLTFTGTAGENVNVWASGSTISACYSLNFSLIGPSGAPIGSSDFCYQANGGFSEVSLPSAGTYTAIVNPYGPLTGSVNVTLSTDVGGAITSGTDQPISINLPGQNARYTFSATSGQRGSVVLQNSTFPGACYSVVLTVLNPDGSQLATSSMCGQGTGFVDAFTFPTTGTYTVLVAPQNGGTGTGDLYVYDFQDVQGSIAANTSINVASQYPGQNALIAFSGAANTQVSIAVTNVPYTGCSSMNLTVLNPDGSQLATTSLCYQSGGTLSNLTLPANGTYTVVVDPQGPQTGAVTLTLASNLNEAISPNTPINITLSAAGEIAQLTFNATAGQLGSVNVTNSTFPGGCYSAIITVLNPDGSQLASTSMCFQLFGFIDQFTFPTTGTYTLVVAPQNGGTGSATVGVYEFSNQTATTSIGSPTTIAFNIPGQNANVAFTGSPGQTLNVWATNVSIPGCNSVNLTLYNPDASQAAGTSLCGQSNGGFQEVHLTQSGSYTLFVDPQGASTGSATIAISTDVTGTISSGEDTLVTITTPGQNAQITFSGTSGQQATVSIANATFSGCYSAFLSLLNPDGSTLTSSVMCGGGGLALSTIALPSTGTYTIFLAPQNGNTGTVDVQLTLQ